MPKTNLPDVQRALVLQGGGALGAYEAGVFQVLYNSIKKDIKNQDENIFDVIAGTSIGAINASFLVSYVIKKRKEGTSVLESWQGSPEELEKFWKLSLSSNPSLIRWWPFYWDQNAWTDAWNSLNNTNRDIATGEAARRYYSAKEFIINGCPNVFSSALPKFDPKFLDNYVLPYNLIPNIWYRYNNYPLKETIKRLIHFPLATNLDEKQPRLLLVSVDAQEGETVTFDSYMKPEGIRKSEYGDYAYDDRKKSGIYEHTIKYDKGIMPDHVMASASVPEHYDYTLVPMDYDYANTDTNTEEQNDLLGYRRFWDGGVLSNTPLRELIHAHQEYWTNATAGDSIPSLEIYILDVWPSLDNYPLPFDLDAILSKKAKSKERSGENRTYNDLLFKQFNIKKVVRIERSPDTDDISNKWCDFSSCTISNLLQKGVQDALTTLQKL